MRFLEQAITDVRLIEPEPFSDDRGLLRRTFCEREFAREGIAFTAKQSNISENRREGTLRGFHYQHPPFQEGKVLSCVRGSLYDIVVDLRPRSPTYLKWASFELTEKNRLALYVPPGCANAWMTLQDETWVLYYHSEFYAPRAEGGMRYDDPLFDFKWPKPPAVVSEKDRSYPLFEEVKR